jgi:hypothetical protein
MQASQHHAFTAQQFTPPKAMRIGSASPENCIALTPRQFEIAEQHMDHPTSRGATIRIGPASFCTLK